MQIDCYVYTAGQMESLSKSGTFLPTIWNTEFLAKKYNVDICAAGKIVLAHKYRSMYVSHVYVCMYIYIYLYIYIDIHLRTPKQVHTDTLT